MNRIVKQHYPVDRLPDDLRTSMPGGGFVTVTVEAESAPARALGDMLAELKAHRATIGDRGMTAEEAVARIRALRDEWDD